MHTLIFTDEHLGLLNDAIGELPHKHAVPLIQAINVQLKAAQDARAAESEKAAGEPKGKPQQDA